MKYLQTFELHKMYARTLGFRYSDPSVFIDVISYYKGETPKEEDIISILTKINVPVENINISSTKEVLNLGTDQTGKPFNLEVDGNVTFNMKVYNEREIEQILEDFSLSMNDLGTVFVAGDAQNKEKMGKV